VYADDTDISDASSPASATADSNRNVSWLALFSNGNAAISVMLTGGVAIHALSLRVVATVLPSVVPEIGGLRFFAWTTTVAVVSAIWGAAFAAPLARSRGLRGAYRASLVLFVAGSIVCALAPNMGVFLTGRLFQGWGGGLLVALAYTTIQRVFPEDLRTRAMVLVPGIWGVAALCGPLLGGALAEWGFWRWAFWIDVPVAAVVAMLAECSLPKSAVPDAPGIAAQARAAFGRLVLLGASVLAVAIGGVSGGALSSGVALVIGIALLVTLLQMEQTADAGVTRFRLLPTGAYRAGNVLGAASLALALMMGGSTAIIYLPYVAVATGGYSPIVGGYLSAIASLTWIVAALGSGSAGREWAERSMVLGPAVLALGLFLTGCGLIIGSFVFMALSVGLLGAGIGAAWAPLGNLMIAHAKETERDVSSAFISTNQMISQAFASALAGMIANFGGFADPALGSIGVVSGVTWLFLSFALVAAAALPLSIIAVRLSAARQPARPLANLVAVPRRGGLRVLAGGKATSSPSRALPGKIARIQES
jgi:MFS family permease